MRKRRTVEFERIALVDAWARLPASIRLALMHLWHSEEDAFALPRDPGNESPDEGAETVQREPAGSPEPTDRITATPECAD
jgi:hypothetical protein